MGDDINYGSESHLTSLLDCDDAALHTWIELHRAELVPQFFLRLKERYADGAALTSQPQLAERATRRAVQVAEALIDQPLSLAYARWARGNWAAHFDLKEAARLYQLALPPIESDGDDLSVARIHGNLMHVYIYTGKQDDVYHAYEHARTTDLRKVF